MTVIYDVNSAKCNDKWLTMISKHILDDHKATLQLLSYVQEIFLGRKDLCDDNVHSWHIKNANWVKMD